MVSDIILESQSLTLMPGEYGQNPITLVPGTDSVVLSYRSDNEDVATVDEIGVIHAISPGTCQITVKKRLKKGRYTVKIKVSASGNGDHLPAARTAKVTVKVK